MKTTSPKSLFLAPALPLIALCLMAWAAGGSVYASPGDSPDNSPGEQGRTVISNARVVGSRPSLGVPENFHPHPSLTEATKVFMVTIYPGEALYSTFGHTAIRIWDPSVGMDLLFNYGQSSIPFDSGFVPNFVTGDLPFMLGVIETRRAYDFYRQNEDRSIYEQELDLSLEKKRQLYEFLSYKALPENRIYIYDFFFDNCTTRIRDLFTLLYGDELTYVLDKEQKSFREEIAPYLRSQAYVRFGINLVFGTPSDRTPSLEQRLYLPFQLRDAIDRARLVQVSDSGEASEQEPIEAASGFIYRQKRGAPQPPPIPPAASMWIFALLILALSASPYRFSPVARVADAILYGLVGFLGSAMLLLWLFSGYEMTTWNLNLLWAWPLHLAAGFFSYRSVEKSRFGRIYFTLASGLTALFLLSIPFDIQAVPAGAIPLIFIVGFRSGLRVLPIKK